MIQYSQLSENVYVLLGHGCDKQLEPDVGIGPEIIMVPRNTSYIQLTECGRGGPGHGVFYNYLLEHGDRIDKKYVHNSTLEQIDKKDFVNSRFTGLANSYMTISKSGMYTLDYIIHNKNLFFDEDNYGEPINYFVNDKSLFDIYSLAYENSLHPTKEQVLTIYKKNLFNLIKATSNISSNHPFHKERLVYLIEKTRTREEMERLYQLTNDTIMKDCNIEVIELMRRFPNSTWIQTACRNPCRTKAQIASGASPNDDIEDNDQTPVGKAYILRRKHSNLGSFTRIKNKKRKTTKRKTTKRKTTKQHTTKQQKEKRKSKSVRYKKMK